jgi:hypothetical protein
MPAYCDFFLGKANVMFDDNARRLHELCEQASREQDREKQHEITQEIERLLVGVPQTLENTRP